jgi:site-specific recombinase XerD
MPAGSLTLWRRHSRTCPHRHKGWRWTTCKCAIWVQGSLGGTWIQRSLGTRNWTAAASMVHSWEAAGKIGAIIRTATPSVAQAVGKFLDDARARKLAPATIRLRQHLLERKLLKFCAAHGYANLDDVTVDALRTFRGTWTYSADSARKRLENLRGFFRFCVESSWLVKNPAEGVKPPKTTQRPVLPFSDDEVHRMLAAIDRLPYRGTYRHKLRPMLLLLRYSGLRIQDAACLGRSRLSDTGKLLLYTQKTGTHVYCPLPPAVAAILRATPNEHPTYFFWHGESTPEHVAKQWNDLFQQIFAAADPPIEDGYPHRFRHTFAISLLVEGVPLEHVSILLGHSSTKVTERHYAAWVKARQERLEAGVQRVWSSVPLLTNGP